MLFKCFFIWFLFFLFFPSLHTRIKLNDMLWYLHVKWKAQKVFEVLDILDCQVKRLDFWNSFPFSLGKWNPFSELFKRLVHVHHPDPFSITSNPPKKAFLHLYSYPSSHVTCMFPASHNHQIYLPHFAWFADWYI